MDYGNWQDNQIGMKMNNFKVGDRVEIINKGFVYATYQAMADAFGLKRFHYAESPSNKYYDVIGLRKHSANDPITIVVAISGEDGEFILGQGGLKLMPDWDL